MRKSYSIVLILVLLLHITGCKVAERGISLPAPKKQSVIQSKTNDYDFPLLTLSASSKKNREKPSENVAYKSSNIVAREAKAETLKKKEEKVQKKEKKPSTFGSLLNLFRDNNPDETNITKKENTNLLKKKPKTTIKPRHKKPGTSSKLIFNKNTSFKNIPLPLPKLSSLNLKSIPSAIPSIPISKIPILNAIIPEGSKVSNRRLKNKSSVITSNERKVKKEYTNPNFPNIESLDMANIRIGKSADYTTLIFDSYVWGGYQKESTEVSKSSGEFEFHYKKDENKIIAILRGYSAFSALLGDQSDLFKDNDVIDSIYIDRYIGNDGIQFVVKLKKEVKLNVVNVDNPGRIILNLYPQ